jgi:hypothetical protein
VLPQHNGSSDSLASTLPNQLPRNRQISPRLSALSREPTQRAEAERVAAEGVLELWGGNVPLCAEVPAAGLRAPEHLTEGAERLRHAGGAGRRPVVRAGVSATAARLSGTTHPPHPHRPGLARQPLPAALLLWALSGGLGAFVFTAEEQRGGGGSALTFADLKLCLLLPLCLSAVETNQPTIPWLGQPLLQRFPTGTEELIDERCSGRHPWA